MKLIRQKTDKMHHCECVNMSTFHDDMAVIDIDIVDIESSRCPRIILDDMHHSKIPTKAHTF